MSKYIYMLYLHKKEVVFMDDTSTIYLNLIPYKLIIIMFVVIIILGIFLFTFKKNKKI